MTFSATKSFLSSVVGAAFDRKLIKSVDDRVAEAMAPTFDRDGRPIDPFASPHARTITWDHLLRQTSDWAGTLWGKPDWADRPADDLEKELARERHAPGSVYEYNDARVNLLALAALEVWRRPLPRVLDEYVMEPIGASRTWRWYGYDNSWVVLDGAFVQSVSGGGHWGGGLFISARDQARFGLLTLHRGRWNERQVLSEEWIRMALTPTPAQPTYGFMNYFLNTGRKFLPAAPAEAFVHVGAGMNAIYVDPVNDLVVVVRWIDSKALPELVKRVLDAIVPEAGRPAAVR
jgi:CubicO group peptidase (beta-lactamase class C family)